ncbi:MAG: hypothetical protein NTZ34_02985 [Chloroflexi bacterium]|nr:hypothetical protein [Chloroflexota bacterium]
MSRIYVLIAAILCMLPVFAIVSCVSPDINITSFQVTPSSITAGQTALLQWNVTGASAVTINNGLGGQSQYGSLEVKPDQTTTYILTASNGSRSVQSTVSLTVNAPATSSIPSSPQILSISAVDTQVLLHHLGETVRVEGDVTYISSWLPTRVSGQGTSRPWTFMFFMKDVQEGAANNAGDGEYCPDCWRDYTSQFRVIITPGNLPLLLPVLNNYFGGGFSLQDQGLIIGATREGRLVYMPSPFWSYGYVAQIPVHVTVQGELVNYDAAPAIYLTQPGQLSFRLP